MLRALLRVSVFRVRLSPLQTSRCFSTQVPRLGHGVNTAKRNRSEAAALVQLSQAEEVAAELIEEGIFSDTIIKNEVDYFFNQLGLQEFYFKRFTTATIKQHVHSLIAAKKLAQATGEAEKIELHLEDFAEDGSGSAFYVATSGRDAALRKAKTIESLSQRVPQSHAFSLSSFKTVGKSIPDGEHRLSFYIFDSHPFVEDPATISENETNIWKLASGVFLRDKTPFIRQRYQDILIAAHGKLAPIVNVYEPYRDGTVPLMLAFQKGRSRTNLYSSLTEILYHNGLLCERKFIETFANEMIVYSFYVTGKTENIPHFVNQVSLLNLIALDPGSKLHSLFLAGEISGEQYVYSYSLARFIYYFLTKASEEFLSIAKAVEKDPLNMNRLVHLRNRLRREAISLKRINECMLDYPDLLKEIFQLFEHKMKPAKELIEERRRSYQARSLLLRNTINKTVTNETDEEILLALVNFNDILLKTNFYKPRKSSLSFRLDPSSLVQSQGYPESPFGLFFVSSSGFHGFHVRFRDVARGGIRIIRSANPEVYNTNLQTLFTENYNLAFTQNKKNKDIPEFGSKGTILLNNPSVNPFNAFTQYVSGLLDLITPQQSMVDYYGREELLFLGPDEGTADYMNWAAEYAGKRGYRYWKAFTTGKQSSLGGIPHDTYGMTTRSVHRMVVGCLQHKGLVEEEVTKLQTGGPDGDLGSNEILLSKDKTIAVVDGSGVVYDPSGLNREELKRLAKGRVPVSSFDSSKLSGGGSFKVLVSERNVQLPDGTVVDGLQLRNEFHLLPYSTAQLFVPCGGRPESVNLNNVHRLFHDEQCTKPRFNIIVEGANLFLTNDARMLLEAAGVTLYKDASANKGGVTSSSMEVLAALSMNDAEFQEHMRVPAPPLPAPAFYRQYVEEIQQRIETNAALEFECIWREAELTRTPRYVLTEQLSDKINLLNDKIQQSDELWNNEQLRLRVMKEAIPQRLIDLLSLEKILKRLPENYSRAVFSSFLASRYIYQFGLHPPEFAFYSFIKSLTVLTKK